MTAVSLSALACDTASCPEVYLAPPHHPMTAAELRPLAETDGWSHRLEAAPTVHVVDACPTCTARHAMTPLFPSEEGQPLPG